MILVTGASGFIGKHVVKKLLDEQQEVLVIVRDIDRYKIQGTETVYKGDLSNISLLYPYLKQYHFETCIHLAWEGIPDYSFEMSSKNLQYGMNILKMCEEIGIPNLVIAGSCWEYENPTGNTRTDDRLSCENSFKAAKNSLHIMAHAFCKEHGIYLNWMRLFYVYGPGQREQSLIPYIINSFKNGKQPRLNGAFNKNDFVHVQDVAEAVVKVSCQHIYPETLNVGVGKSECVFDIVKIVAKQMDFSLDENQYECLNSVVNFYADADEMWEHYQWKAGISLEEGIAGMCEQRLKVD